MSYELYYEIQKKAAVNAWGFRSMLDAVRDELKISARKLGVNYRDHEIDFLEQELFHGLANIKITF